MSPVDISRWEGQPPLFVRLLAAEVAGTNRAKAAERIGISRTAVSLVLLNKYRGRTLRVERQILDVLGHIECPAIGEILNVEQCQGFYQRPAPTHNPMAMQHWRACQQCPLNPNCGGNSNATVH